MDTKLNPNGPDPRDKHSAETKDDVRWSDEMRTTAGTRYTKSKRINKPLGFILLLATISLFTMVLLSAVIINNAQASKRVVYGSFNTSVEFQYRYDMYRFMGELATQVNALCRNLLFSQTVTYATSNTMTYGVIPETIIESQQEAASSSVEIPDVSAVYTGEQEVWVSGSITPEITAVYPSEPGYLASDIGVEKWFYYYVSTPNAVYTNLPAGTDWSEYRYTSLLSLNLLELPHELIMYLDSYNDENYSNDGYATIEALREKGISGEIYIVNDSTTYNTYMYSLLQDNDNAFWLVHTWRNTMMICFVSLAVVLLCAFGPFRKSFLWAVGSVYALYCKQPFIMKLALVAVGGCVSYVVYTDTGSYSAPTNTDNTILIFILSAFTLLYLLLSIIYIIFALTGERRGLRDEPDIRWIRRFVGNFRSVWKTREKVLIVCLLTGCLLCVGLLFGCGLGFVAMFIGEADVGFIFFVLCGIGTVVSGMLLSLIFTHAQMISHTEDIAHGAFHAFPETKGWFNRPLNNLSRVNEGFSKAVTEAVRSERMKSELLTNVSHDLKTPLTSIVNYVALLKDTSLMQSDTAAEYINVIDIKTQRLKMLIEDLFEAAKLQSGSIVMEAEDVNVVDLLKQTLGELNEKIDASGIRFITYYGAERIVLRLDGKRMWRAFENLIGNILKYAPACSRAYISAETDGDMAVLTFKNVSNYALDFEPDELFERFKRGDASRSTEGSGLGLSIARGIVEQSGGHMRIVTDGDLFKVVIEFQL